MIEEIIRDWIRQYPISSGDDLIGFILDAEHALSRSELVANVRVDRGDDPLSLVNAVVHFRDVGTLQQIPSFLATAWSELAYPAFQTLSIQPYVEATTLRFITANAAKTLCATGLIVATSPNYAKLVRSFNADFAGVVGPLPHLEGGVPEWAA